MNVLFVYKYLTLGGVESVLRARLRALEGSRVRASAWFLADGPGRIMFKDVKDSIGVGSPRDLLHLTDRIRFDVVCTIDTEEIFPVYAEIPGSPGLVIESHSPYRENRVYLRWLKRLPVGAFWVPSQHQAEQIGRRLKHIAPVRVVPNIIGQAFLAAIRPFPEPLSRPRLGWVGRLDAVKNWALLLDVASRVKQHNPSIELHIIGHGDGHRSERNLYQAAKKRDLLGNLRWFDGLPPSAMPRWLDAIRDSGGVVVSTSRHESFGLSVAEAMARACPVVAPNAGPFPGFIEGGEHGLLYKPGSSKDAAAKVLQLLHDAEARKHLGNQARQRVLAEFSPQAALPHLIRALETAVSSA